MPSQPKTAICPKCSGAGRYPELREKPCPECGGAGVSRHFEQLTLCPRCAGTGKLTAYADTTCTTCRGTGRLDAGDAAGTRAGSDALSGRPGAEALQARRAAKRNRRIRAVQGAAVTAGLVAILWLTFGGTLPWWTVLILVPLWLVLTDLAARLIGGGRIVW